MADARTDRPTGEQMADEIRAFCSRKRIPYARFAALCGRHDNLVSAIATTKHPKPDTVRKVRQVMDEWVDEKANDTARNIRRTQTGVHVRDVKPAETMERVSRDPCPRCGARGDAGCGCKPMKSDIVTRTLGGVGSSLL